MMQKTKRSGVASTLKLTPVFPDSTLFENKVRFAEFYGSLLFQLIILFLMVWEPNSTSLVPFILVFAIWGLSDGFYASQLCSLTGVMFADTCEEAFSAYRMMQGVGLTVAYSYSPILPLDIKLYMLSGLGIIAWVLYVTMEYLDRRSQRIKNLVVEYQQTTV